MKYINDLPVYEENDICSLDEYSELMAQKVHQKFKNAQYDDTEIKKDISDIKIEQQTQNKDIENLQINDNKQDSLISKLKQALINVETEQTKSLHIKDASTIPAQLEVFGNCEQETREGYNLLDVLGNKSAGTTQTVNGVTYTVNKDGSIKVNGTATDNADYFIAGNWGLTEAIIKLNGTYKLQLVDNNNTAIRIYLLNQSSVIASATNSTSLTKTQDVTGWFIRVNAGQTVNTTIYPQLVEGTEDKEYEQYGAMPSPDYPSEVKSLGSNKNLYNEETTEMNKYLDGDTGTIGNSTVSKVSDYIELTGKEYTINYTNDTNTRGYSFYDEDKTFIFGQDNNKAPYTVTKPENAKYIRISVPASALDIKIEEGTEETSYSPYGQGSTEIKISNVDKTKEISKILYIQQEMLEGDYFVKEADGWKEVHGWKKYTFTGNETFVMFNEGLFYSSSNIFSDAKMPVNNSTAAEIYCNALMSDSYSNIWNKYTNNKIGLNADGTSNPRIVCNQFSTATEFKEFLQQKYNEGNPVYAYYKTAAVTKLPCTEEQSAVLEELNNLDLFDGTNNIITAEDIALLKLNYIADTKTYVDNKYNTLANQILEIAGGN